MILDTKFIGYKSALLEAIFSPLYQAQNYLKHLETKYGEIQTFWKNAMMKFLGEKESIERFIKKEIEEEQKRDLTIEPMVLSAIQDLKLMATKGITSPGLEKYLREEVFNKEDISKLEIQVYQQLSRIEEIINLEIFSSIEQVIFLLSKIIGPSKLIEVETLFGIDKGTLDTVIESTSMLYYKFEDLFLHISEAKLDIKNFFVYLNYQCLQM